MFIRILPLLLLAQIIHKWCLTVLFMLQPICDKCQISSCCLWKWNIIQAELCIFLYTLYMSLYIIVLYSYKYIIFYIIIFLIYYISLYFIYYISLYFIYYLIIYDLIRIFSEPLYSLFSPKKISVIGCFEVKKKQTLNF